MRELILASGSPRRLELKMSFDAINFSYEKSEVDQFKKIRRRSSPLIFQHFITPAPIYLRSKNNTVESCVS
jgi:predicted house-cleaning NTP pyrophosphatase (Maf/HAM1 superfamily)